MSVAQAPQDRGASPLMSNNPFRNKVAASSASISRPISTNPFLDSNELQKEYPTTTIKPVPSDSQNETVDLFASMGISQKPSSPQRQPRPYPGAAGPPPYTNSAVPSRSENVRPPPSRGQMTGHRPSISEEERRRQFNKSSRRPTELDIFADATDAQSRDRKPRRNSESSVRDKPGLLVDVDDEKRRRQSKYADPKRPSKSKPSKKLDVIDKLDVTSIYGTGLFHHDGPFDACNPHRNRRRDKKAPMQAFPKDSANMQIGGSGPLNKKMDYDRFHGRGEEAHIDFNEATTVDEDAQYLKRPLPDRTASFNATSRVDPVHGQETVGLGTSTFLEGAPASRAAIQRRDSEYEASQQFMNGPGLSRKKSLAQKIRAVRPGGQPRVQSPDNERPATSPLGTGKSESAVNPFFKDYDNEYERKGQQIAFAEEQRPQRARAPSSPRQGAALERQLTGDGELSPTENKPSGFLGRMKSLKKSKSRYERREPS